MAKMEDYFGSVFKVPGELKITQHQVFQFRTSNPGNVFVKPSSNSKSRLELELLKTSTNSYKAGIGIRLNSKIASFEAYWPDLESA